MKTKHFGNQSLLTSAATVVTRGMGPQLWAACIMTFLTIWTASAATITVTNSADSGPGTLRKAIAAAGSTNTVVFATNLSGQTITLTSGQIIISNSVILDASGLVSGIRISGNANSRVFQINQFANVAMTNLTIMNGHAGSDGHAGSAWGGGIKNSGDLTLTSCTVSGNSAFAGGGIYNSGDLTLTSCTVSGNSAGAVGGGILNDDGTLTLTSCTVSGNSAPTFGDGGGILNYGTLTLTSCTVSGNYAGAGGGIENEGDLTLTSCTVSGNSTSGNSAYFGGGYGGGIENYGALTLTSCTVSDNSAYYDGGGIYNDGPLTLENSIVAGNNADGNGPNVFGDIQNEFGSNLTDGDPVLAPLGDYGGPTLTMPPLPGSPAIDAGDDSVANFLATDQRGSGFPRVAGKHVDIGAVETDYAVSPDDFTIVTSTGDTLNGLTNDGVSLREAVAIAPNGSRITFSPALTNSTITLTNGQLAVHRSLTIDAAGLNITIDGNGTVTTNRIFEFASGTTNQLAGLTLTHGRAAGNGGAILLDSGATLIITNSTLANNTADSDGGGIYNSYGGTLTLQNSTLANNSASSAGGGIYNSGTLTIINSTLANNVGGYGGGIFNGGLIYTNGIYIRVGTLTIINSTLANNSAGDSGGGGILNDSDGTLTISDSTLANNSAGGSGGGI